MVQIKSAQIKMLREKTGAGIMDCKTALLENSGNMEESITWLRKKGIASADKKSARVAAEGLIGISFNNSIACMLEVNSETDFVSKNTDFQNFIEQTLKVASKKCFNLEELLDESYDGSVSIREALKNLIAKIGENIVVRRIKYLVAENDDNYFGFYVHNKVNDYLGKIGSVVLIKSKEENKENIDLAKKIAMHVSASKPMAINKDNLKPETLSKEKEIFKSQLISSGKPENIVDRIVEGKITKFISQITLLEQNWVMDTSLKVKEVIDDFNKKNKEYFEVIDYGLLILGEGVEIVEKNFKDEVESQL